MIDAPIQTERLLLRPYQLSDAPAVTSLVGDVRISEMTSNIPHPYTVSMAADWIARILAPASPAVTYAVVERHSGQLIGTVSFPRVVDGCATLGYWMGVAYWGLGYATEAMSALMEHARTTLGIRHFEAMHIAENLRSRSVILKLGLVEVGTQTRVIKGRERLLVVYRTMTVADSALD
ncbi:GNAT family N-acetyltransferase [Pseudomonas sp. Marseille-QA0892]